MLLRSLRQRVTKIWREEKWGGKPLEGKKSMNCYSNELTQGKKIVVVYRDEMKLYAGHRYFSLSKNS